MLALAFLLLFAPAHAASPDEVAVIRMRAESAEAGAAFDAAQLAFDSGDYVTAAAGFESVGKLVPRFDLAFRRLCQSRLEQGQRSKALPACRKAAVLEASPANQLTLAKALVALPRDVRVPAGARREAATLVGEAMRAAPEDPTIQRVACTVSWRNRDPKRFDRCSARLTVLAPDDPMTWYFVSLSAGGRERWGEARDALDRAVELGLPAEKAATIERMMLSHRSAPEKLFGLAISVAMGWLGWLLTLFVVGSLLSAATLRVAAKLPGLGADEPLPGRTMRRLYGAVLGLCGATWYASLPILAAFTIGIGGAMAWFLFGLLTNPIPPILALIGTFSALAALIKGFFLPDTWGGLGEGVDLAEHPRLKALLDELAEQVGSPRVDRVYLEPGADLAVFQRGGRRASVGGKPVRCLVLGGALLDGLRVGDLKPALAHEMGHLAANDVGRGDFALATRALLFRVAIDLVERDQDHWWNPTWLFLDAYNRIFQRLSFGASRLQEVLADRRAVLATGSEGFALGHERIISTAVRFDLTLGLVVDDALGSTRVLPDLYAAVPSRPPSDWEVQREIEKIRERPRSPYDSHPADEERVAFARRLGVPTPPWSVEDTDPAWNLLRHPGQVRKRLTALARGRINATYGVELRGR